VRWLRSVAVWGAILWVGCADPDDSDGSPPPAEPETDPSKVFCGGLCAAYDRCALELERELNLPNCFDDCMLESDALQILRADLMHAEAACMQEEPCDRVLYERYWTESCYETASAAIAPTAATYERCQSIAADSFKCGWWFSVDDCAESYRVFSDEVVAGVQACFAESLCDEIDPCVELVLSGGGSA